MRNTLPDSDSTALISTSNANESTKSLNKLPERIIMCCPFCNSSQVYIKSGHRGYRCLACKQSFPTFSKKPAPEGVARFPSYLKIRGAQAWIKKSSALTNTNSANAADSLTYQSPNLSSTASVYAQTVHQENMTSQAENTHFQYQKQDTPQNKQPGGRSKCLFTRLPSSQCAAYSFSGC